MSAPVTEDNHLDVSARSAPDYAVKYATFTLSSVTNASDGWRGMCVFAPQEAGGAKILGVRAIAADIGTSLEWDAFVGNADSFTEGSSILTGTVTMSLDLTWYAGELATTPATVVYGEQLHIKQIAAVGTNSFVTFQIRYRPLLGSERM